MFSNLFYLQRVFRQIDLGVGQRENVGIDCRAGCPRHWLILLLLFSDRLQVKLIIG